MGKHERNKKMVKFPRDTNTASKKAIISRKAENTATSIKNVSQIRLSKNLDRFLRTFEPSEST